MVASNEEGLGASPKCPRIVTDWKRFACGLWRLPQGDISEAYSGNIFPRLKAFTHEGRLFTNGGYLFSGPVRSFATCYPLILSHEYTGPDSVRYSYEGKTGKHNGKTYKLGPKMIFASSDPTVLEWRRMFRVIYADGGVFVHGLTYHEFLRRSTPKTPNEVAALEAEVTHWREREMPQSQEEMRQFLDRDAIVSVPAAHPQLELAF